MDCIFCKIADGSIPAAKIYQDDYLIAFKDINPQAPTHVLIIPREHIACAADITPEHAELMGHIWTAIPKLARELGVADGFRVVTNSGELAGQTVGHLHFHLLGARKLNIILG